MNGIELGSGINDCYWNFEGKCTNQRITRNEIPYGFSRDWDSKQNCTYTQLGVCLCSEYFQESEYQYRRAKNPCLSHPA